MKQTIQLLSFCAFLLVGYAAQAQFSIGVRGGLLSSTLDRSEITAGTIVENRTGLLGGLVAEFRINAGFAIQPEVDWIQKGSKSSYTISVPLITTIQSEFTERINYVEVPILLKGGFKVGPIRLDALAGPSFGYAINGNRTTQVTTTVLPTNQTNKGEKTTQEFDFDQDFKKADIGAQGGLALSASIGKGRVFVDGRYLYGLSNLNAENNSQVEIKSRGVVISAGLMLEL